MKRLIGTVLLLAVCLTLHAQGGSWTVRRNADKVARALYFLENRYVDTLDMDKMVDAMLDNLMSQLDPHSTYIPRERVEALNEPLGGSFEGVGIEYAVIADTVTLQGVIAGGPAESVGLLAGDKLLTIDGETVAGTGITAEGVRDRLRGPKGTRVDVTVLRSGAVIPFSLRRDTIPIESIDAAYTVEHKDKKNIRLLLDGVILYHLNFVAVLCPDLMARNAFFL